MLLPSLNAATPIWVQLLLSVTACKCLFKNYNTLLEGLFIYISNYINIFSAIHIPRCMYFLGFLTVGGRS